jgi:hypothetical protein
MPHQLSNTPPLQHPSFDLTPSGQAAVNGLGWSAGQKYVVVRDGALSAKASCVKRFDRRHSGQKSCVPQQNDAIEPLREANLVE